MTRSLTTGKTAKYCAARSMPDPLPHSRPSRSQGGSPHMKRLCNRLGLKLAATGVMLLALGGAAWAEETGYGRPLDVSLDGHRSDWLFNVTTVSITVLFLIMAGILVWTSLVHRDTPARKAH